MRDLDGPGRCPSRAMANPSQLRPAHAWGGAHKARWARRRPSLAAEQAEGPRPTLIGEDRESHDSSCVVRALCRL
jgi:hypothetical protein